MLSWNAQAKINFIILFQSVFYSSFLEVLSIICENLTNLSKISRSCCLNSHEQKIFNLATLDTKRIAEIICWFVILMVDSHVSVDYDAKKDYYTANISVLTDRVHHHLYGRQRNAMVSMTLVAQNWMRMTKSFAKTCAWLMVIPSFVKR